MSARTASRLAWSLWSLTVVLTALSLLLLVLNLRYPNAPVPNYWLGNALVVIDATVGAIVASRRSENPVGWLLCLSGVAVSASTFTSLYAVYALLARPGSLPAGGASAWVAAWILPIIIGLQVAYLLLFPTGRLPGRRWRWLAWLIGIFVVVGVVLSAFSSGAYFGALGSIRNPLGIEGFTNAWKVVLVTVAPLLYCATALSVLVRLRRAVGVERQQLKWFAYAIAIYALSIAFHTVALVIDEPRWFGWAANAFFTAAGTMVPISIGIAILRFRLYDVDRIINRTLVYGSLTVTLALLYFGGVTLTQNAFRVITGNERLPQLAVVASTLVIAALFNPLRSRLQKFVDRLFYRQKYDAGETLAGFSAKLRDEVDLELLKEDLIGVVRGTVRPSHVSLWLREKEPGG
ncbi:hypothetical protein BH18ACT10_BH18ACT10_12470 [soil metagenome]